MGFQQNQVCQSFDVASASVIRKLRFVKIGANGQAVECNTANEDSIGVSQHESKATETSPITVDIRAGGVARVEAGAAVDASTVKNIATDNQGRAVVATGAGTKILGTALSSATAAGEIISVLLVAGAGEV